MFENDINLLYSKENYFLILKLNHTTAARVAGDDIELGATRVHVAAAHTHRPFNKNVLFLPEDSLGFLVSVVRLHPPLPPFGLRSSAEWRAAGASLCVVSRCVWLM